MLSSGARATEMAKFEAKHLNGNRLTLPIEKSKGKRRSRVVYLPVDALAIVQRLASSVPGRSVVPKFGRQSVEQGFAQVPIPAAQA